MEGATNGWGVTSSEPLRLPGRALPWRGWGGGAGDLTPVSLTNPVTVTVVSAGSRLELGRKQYDGSGPFPKVNHDV